MATKTVKLNSGIPGLFRLLNSLPKETQDALRDRAQEIAERIASEARRSYEGGQGSGAWAYVAPRITAKRDRLPTIAMEGNKLLPGRRRRPNRDNQKIGSLMWGAEFGSDRSPQFDPWRGNGEDAGYGLYPAFRRLGRWAREEYVEALADAILDAARRQG